MPMSLFSLVCNADARTFRFSIRECEEPANVPRILEFKIEKSVHGYISDKLVNPIYPYITAVMSSQMLKFSLNPIPTR